MKQDDFEEQKSKSNKIVAEKDLYKQVKGIKVEENKLNSNCPEMESLRSELGQQSFLKKNATFLKKNASMNNMTDEQCLCYPPPLCALNKSLSANR